MKNLRALFTELDRDGKIACSSSLMLIGFAFIVTFYYIKGYIYGLPYPYNTFLTPPIPFGDFLGVYDQWGRLKFNGIGFGLSYFPSTYLFINLFTKISSPIIAVLLFNIIFYVPLLIYIWSNTKDYKSIFFQSRIP